MSRERFFSKQQKREHAEEIGGWHSELIDGDTGLPYPGKIESHHAQAYSKGGETEPENMMFLDKVSHAIIHLMSDEVESYNLIKARLSPDELNELHRRGY